MQALKRSERRCGVPCAGLSERSLTFCVPGLLRRSRNHADKTERSNKDVGELQ